MTPTKRPLAASLGVSPDNSRLGAVRGGVEAESVRHGWVVALSVLAASDVPDERTQHPAPPARDRKRHGQPSDRGAGLAA